MSYYGKTFSANVCNKNHYKFSRHRCNFNNYKNKVGKIEFDFSEIIFLNEEPNDWKSSKKMKTVISLLDSGTSFELLANKFSDLIHKKQT